MDKQKLIDRARKLMQMTTDNGASEAEAIAATEKLNALMAEHNLSMTEVSVRQAAQHCEEEVYVSKFASRNHQSSLAAVVGEFCDCECVSRSRPNGMNYAFFGFPEDVKIASYLMAVLCDTMERELKAYLKGAAYGGRTVANSFRYGFVQSVGRRLRVMKMARAKPQATGTSLVVLKTQLVSDEHDKKYPNLKKGRTPTPGSDYNATIAGHAAGQNASIHTAIGTGERSKAIA